MTENKTNSKQTNVVGANKIATPDGSAKAVVTLSMLSVNNNLASNPLESGTFLKFPTSLFGDAGIKKLSFAMNDINFEKTQYGVSANVSIFVKNAAQLAYLTDKIKKGSKLRIVHATATFDAKYGLQLNVRPGDIAFIENKADAADTTEESGKPEEFDVSATGI